MRHLDEYREGARAEPLLEALAATVTRPWTVMEVCGGQTHAFVRHGLDARLPPGLELVHGPGCPVCVTPLETIDRAHALARDVGVILCSYGDMLRVPGSATDLLDLKARGADVRVVYSPLDALAIAEANPGREVVFFAIGFETTAPANAMAIRIARARRLSNFTALVSQVLVPPMMSALLQAPDNRVRAFLGPGHVCTIMGLGEYEPIARRYAVPIAVTGFEPVDLLAGLLAVVRQLEAGEARVENVYARVVRAEGNPHARAAIEEVFDVCDRAWRGIGNIPKSGLRLRWEYRDHDAERRFDLGLVRAEEHPDCISGQVLKGLKRPTDCAAFGTRCTPARPLGATMVSNEGACAAYHEYRGTR